MADSAATAYIELDARTAKFIQELNKAAGAWERTEKRLKSGTSDATKSVAQASDAQSRALKAVGAGAGQMSANVTAAFAAVRNAVAVAVAALGVRELVQYANEWDKLANRLRVVTGDSQDFVRVQRQLFDVAQRTGDPLRVTTGLYADLAAALRSSGVEQQRALGLTEALSYAAEISGSGIEELEGSLQRFARGLADGSIESREFTTLLFQVPRAAQAVADGLDVSVERLRALATQGKLSVGDVVGALESQGAVLAAEAGKIVDPIEGSVNRARNAFLQAFGPELAVGFQATARILSSEVIGIIGKAEDLQNVFALVGGASQVAFLAVVNTARIVTFALQGIESALNLIQIGFARLRGEKPFENKAQEIERLSDKAADLARDLELLGRSAGNVKSDGYRNIANELERVNARLAELDPEAKAAPLLQRLSAIRDEASRLSGQVFPSDTVITRARAALTTTEELIKGTTGLIEKETADWQVAIDAGLRPSAASQAAFDQKIAGMEAKLATLTKRRDTQRLDIEMRATGDPEVRAKIQALWAEGGKLRQQLAGMNIDVNAKGAENDLSRLESHQRQLNEQIGKFELLGFDDLKAAIAKVGKEYEASEAAARRAGSAFRSSASGTVQIDVATGFAAALKAAQDRKTLEERTSAEVRRIVITGEERISEELRKVLEQRAQLLTESQEKEALAAGKASGTKATFDREVALSRNRLQIAESTARELLAVRETVVNAGWIVDLRVNADTGALAGIQAEADKTRTALQTLRQERVAIVAGFADPGAIDREIDRLREKLADIEPLTLQADAESVERARRDVTSLEVQIANLENERLTLSADTSAITEVDADLAQLRERLATALQTQVTVQGAVEAAGQAAALRREIESLEGRRIVVQTVAENVTETTADIARLKAELADIEQVRLTLPADSEAYIEAAERARSLAAQIDDLQGRQIRIEAAIAGLTAAESSLASLRSELEAVARLRVTLSADSEEYAQATVTLQALEAQIMALERRRISLVADLDSSEAQAKLRALDIELSELESRRANPPVVAGFAFDFESQVGTLSASIERQQELARQSAEEVRKITIAGEQQISQDLVNIIEARAHAAVEAERRQAELRASVAGSTVVFDQAQQEKALGEARVRIANETADAIIEAQDRVREGGALSLPTTDPGAIQAQTQAAAEAMLEQWRIADEQRLESDQLLNSVLFQNSEAAGQALIELAARQARERVLAEYEARNAALSEFGEEEDPATRAQFEEDVQRETLERERELLNERLKLQQQFGSQYITIQRAVALAFGKDWATAHKQAVMVSAAFASAALNIAGALFGENKKVAIAIATINTLVGVTKALELPFPFNLAAAAQVAAVGFAQVSSISSTSVGSAGAFGGVGGGARAPQLEVSQNQPGADRQNAVTIRFEGDIYGWDDYVRQRIIDSIRDAVDNRDVVIVSGNSRQAQLVREGG